MNRQQEKTHIILSHSVEETRKLGFLVASFVRPGDVIALDGDLGAGKTHFSQGFGEGLGVIEEVVSPTFTLMQEYRDGRLPFYHFDLYRLEDPCELEDIAFYEYVEGTGVSVIEWARKFPEELPDDYLQITIKVEDENSRLIEMGSVGPNSTALLGKLYIEMEGFTCVM
ncbi:MAG: tRNA (adenosine(37)-N6)-threonylcarbamoyltransferase complex ATPase subunit type 1 TsaE [Anaerotardibacter sp.]